MQEDKQGQIIFGYVFFRSRFMYKASLASMFHQGHPSLFFFDGFFESQNSKRYAETQRKAKDGKQPPWRAVDTVLTTTTAPRMSNPHT